MAALSAAEKQLFSDPNFVTLSTLRKDGRPRSVVLWVDVDGSEVLINGGRTREWINNIRRDPRVALAVYDRQAPYRYVAVQGTATAITDEGADEHYQSLREKYRGIAPPQRPRPEGSGDRPPSEHRTIVRVRVDRVTSRGVG
jgi:PPOX class probable F420-dependent enzyme